MSEIEDLRSEYAFVLGMLIQYAMKDSVRGHQNLEMVLALPTSKAIAQEGEDRLLASMYRELGIAYK